MTMIEIVLTIDKENVYWKVAQTTFYTGAKTKMDDNGAYERIFTTDDDKLMLERFWNK